MKNIEVSEGTMGIDVILVNVAQVNKGSQVYEGSQSLSAMRPCFLSRSDSTKTL